MVALTSEAGRGSGPSRARETMDDVLGKPFEAKDMIALLDRWLPPSCRATAPGGRPVDNPASPALPPDPDDAAHLNLEVLEGIRRIQGQQAGDLLQRVVRSYLDHTPQLVEDLGRALNAGDGARVRTVAHTLKSSSANVGAQTVGGGLPTPGSTRAAGPQR